MRCLIKLSTSSQSDLWKEGIKILFFKWNNICGNVDGPRDYHTKWSKSEIGRQIPYDITYMWTLNYNSNELIYKTKTELETQRTDLC